MVLKEMNMKKQLIRALFPPILISVGIAIILIPICFVYGWDWFMLSWLAPLCYIVECKIEYDI